jgi:hypothetical protein
VLVAFMLDARLIGAWPAAAARRDRVDGRR